MDLHFTQDEASAEEISAIDGALGAADARSNRTASTGHAARSDRHLLLPVLHAIQGSVGWVSPGALNYACKRLNVPPADAFGVADFYSMFATEPTPRVVRLVCDDIACQAKGGPGVLDGDLAGQRRQRSPCLGLCERAPASLLCIAGPKPGYCVLAPSDVELDDDLPAPDGFRAAVSTPQAGQPQLKLLARVGKVDPTSLADYRAHGGFQALEKARELGPEGVIEQVAKSNLLGRGGAAFPAGVKWKAVAEAEGPKYVICNADESEPGTFKDRIVMEADPFVVVEAMAIAGFATGAEKGFIYIRGEYPLATQTLENAIEQTRKAGFLGADFDIELRRGAGAYICGEETALFNSIEGFRGEPRNKPPFPTQSGLFGRPTLVNNVETLANVPLVLLGGGEEYASIGTSRSAGPKLFCLSGHIARPGVYEAEFGITVRELIDLAGGETGRLQAVLVGGAAGAFLTPDELDTPFTFEGMREVGATLGSAVVMPFDETVDLRKILLRIAEFFRDESCGQCVPCRVGAVRQEELLERLVNDRPLGSVNQELRLLNQLGQVMRDASICGLGQTASSAIESALAKFPIFK